MNKVDLLFIVDVTASMDGFISQAQEKMNSILNSLKEKFKVDLRVGLSLYKDHPPQDESFVTATFNLDTIEKSQEFINKIHVGGGGDIPEAVIDGIIDGIEDMSWRDGSKRIAFLIGDAPPHGMDPKDGCCACGKTWGDAVFVSSREKVSIYSIILGGDYEVTTNFNLISSFTGSIVISEDLAMEAILKALSEEFNNLNLDSKVLEMLSQNRDTKDICEMLSIDRDKLSNSKARISSLVM